MVYPGRGERQNRVFIDFSGHLRHFRIVPAGVERGNKLKPVGRLRTKKKLRHPLPNLRFHNSDVRFCDGRNNKSLLDTACCDSDVSCPAVCSVFFFTYRDYRDTLFFPAAGEIMANRPYTDSRSDNSRGRLDGDFSKSFSSIAVREITG